MTRDDFTERAARHAVRLFSRTPPVGDYWDTYTEPYRQAVRADVAEVLDVSGYPAALDEAAEFIALYAPTLHHLASHKGDWPDCRRSPCDRAHAWLAEHIEQEQS